MRLVSIRVGGIDGPEVRFHRDLTVVSGDRQRDFAAEVARSVVGGRRPGELVAEIRGQVVTGGGLPPITLEEDETLLLSAQDLAQALAVLVDDRRTALTRETAELDRAQGALDAERRELRARLDATSREIAGVRRRLEEEGRRAERLATLAGRAGADPGPLVEALGLLDGDDGSVHPPEADALARRWERHQRLVEAASVPAHVLAERVASLERELVEARAGLARARRACRSITGEDRAELERRHAAVEEGSRLTGRSARRRLEEARTAERELLSELGFESQMEYLLYLSTGGYRPEAEDERRRAETVVAAAESAHEDMRELQVAAAGRDQVEEDGRRLRAEIVTLLGRDPGDDVVGALKAHRVSTPDPVALARVGEWLEAAGVDPGPDPVATARRFLATRGSRATPSPEEVELAALRERSAQLEADSARLETERRRLEEVAQELDLRGARLEAQAKRASEELVRLATPSGEGPDLGSLRAEQVEEVLRRCLARHPWLDHVGPLPIVVDGALPALSREARAEALHLLDRLAHEVQVVVVSDDAAIVQWARGRDGGAAVVSLRERGRRAAQERRRAARAERQARKATEREAREAAKRVAAEAEAAAKREAEAARVAEREAKEAAKREAREARAREAAEREAAEAAAKREAEAARVAEREAREAAKRVAAEAEAAAKREAEAARVAEREAREAAKRVAAESEAAAKREAEAARVAEREARAAAKREAREAKEAEKREAVEREAAAKREAEAARVAEREAKEAAKRDAAEREAAEAARLAEQEAEERRAHEEGSRRAREQEARQRIEAEAREAASAASRPYDPRAAAYQAEAERFTVERAARMADPGAPPNGRSTRELTDGVGMTPGAETVVTERCVAHAFHTTTLRCSRCELPFCDECLVEIGGAKKRGRVCVSRALILAGVRTRDRRARRR
ncbi:MAG: hypothetical protein M5U14_04495 [Acidimicrobiia bacterium]|nr:hypothetical protein [Acidimicrobiia bacterium]